MGPRAQPELFLVEMVTSEIDRRRMKQMRQRLGRLCWALGVVAIGACSKSMPMNACVVAGAQQHEDVVRVARGSENGPDFDRCAAGDCYALCTDVRGNPGDGSRVQIVTCTRTSIAEVDAAADDNGGAPGAADGGTTSVSLDITYVVYSCPTAD